jgi:hypothetical protein
MKFNLAVDYKVKGLRVGSDRNQTSTAYTVQEFELKELEAEKTPIVLEWLSDPTHYDEQLENPSTDVASSRCYRHVRKLGEQFYTPMLLSPHYGFFDGQHVPNQEMTVDIFRHITETHTNTGWLRVGNVTSAFRSREERVNRDDRNMYEGMFYNTLERRTDELKAITSNLVLIDDVVYRKCIEPDIRFLPVSNWISHNQRERVHILDVRLGSFHWYEQEPSIDFETPKPKRFWIEDLDEALAHLSILNEGCSNAGESRAFDVSSEIFARSNLEDGIYRTANRCERELLRAAKFMAQQLGATTALSLGDDKFQALKLLTLALNSDDSDVTIRNIADAHDILKRDGATLLNLTDRIGVLLDDMPVRVGGPSITACFK